MTKIFKSPFYCGLIAHGLMDGQIVEISKALFLTINEIHQKMPGYGVAHKKEVDEVPLKVFVHCSDCGSPFTGYIVKAKNLWYYKCLTNGCRCNKSAKEMHAMFLYLLGAYSVRPHLHEPLQAKMELLWREINRETLELREGFKKQLDQVNQKIENVEEGRYVTKEMSQEM